MILGAGTLAVAGLTFAAGLTVGYAWGHDDGWVERAKTVETPDTDPRK